MEEKLVAMEMLDLIPAPALCVENGIIVKANDAAMGYSLTPQTPIVRFLQTGSEEYQDFSGGSLYLSLSAGGQRFSASLRRIGSLDVFILEAEEKDPALQALALAGVQLRMHLSTVMAAAGQLLPSLELPQGSESEAQAARLNQGLYRLHRIACEMTDTCHYAAKPALNWETRNFTAVFQELLEKAAALIPEAGQAFRFTNLAVPVHGLMDTPLLERAVWNLLSNAMKFTPKGGLVTASLRQSGSRLLFTVQDSGVGIPNSLLGSMYARYQREPLPEDGRQGLGLGLLLVRTAAILHGGTLLVEQPREGGTRVTMTLAPRRKAEDLLRSPIPLIDYQGGMDRCLIELSDVLPPELYRPENIH